MEIPKNYNHEFVESKWLTQWTPELYSYGGGTTKERFIIDTPPPYPTGNFHLGNALNWCYIDFIARYKRMRGYDVLFPQGWDCHGLPTEVKVETTYNLTKNQIPRNEFRGLCESLTHENIALMKSTMQRLAFSIDWSHEFVTMNKEYYSKTQKSFIQMLRQGLIYKSEHPVNWCPRCETAIAFAEVEYEARSTELYHICFQGKDSSNIKIATTRPELLGACVAVAVHPDDIRYAHLIGTIVRVPLYDDEVPVIADDAVDPAFGTGAVMICTFGDKQDVRWWKKHNLPLKKAIGKDGHVIDSRYSGLTINEAKQRIVGDLLKREFVYQQELIEQSVGYHDRCGTPIEILSESQWFVKIDKRAIVRRASQIDWIPTYALGRLIDWTESVEWDWCISRQRVFATPIPVWYCSECKQMVVAEEECLPVDPTEDTPTKACKCGSCSFTPETDVLDTWMDSSISALSVAGWPDASMFRKQFPTQLRPQGHDIIRTWAFYSILRSDALVSEKPWECVVVNGMVLGEDSQKMSKSLGNIIAPESVVAQYGTDVLRQWAAIGGSVGSDVAFNTNDLVAASRFLTKLWNVFRFSMIHIANYRCNPVVYGSRNPMEIWLLSHLRDLVNSVTVSMDKFAFDDALKEIRSFVWNVLADNYIEAAKGRLYDN
ncbi:MAG: valine--tRNA ligase, partial [Euryarchaeota archaeon]|nr:valine--tRNA ligase [Euryarchaeota archaeon]